MGKATAPRIKRQSAPQEQQEGIERINGVDHNTKGSPLIWWRAQKQLSDSQEAGIAYALRLWSILGTEPRTTSGYGESIRGGGNSTESERVIQRQLDAKADLARLNGYVPEPYWRVFENAIRFDEPAGVIGSREGWASKSGKTRALAYVQFVADLIAMNERLLPG